MSFIDGLTGYWKKRQQSRAEAAYEQALALWRQEDNELLQELVAASAPEVGDSAASPIVLHKGERAVLVVNGAALVEPKRLPGHWVGGYSGVSFRVMKGVSVHTGSSRGTYVQGPEAPTRIAMGTATITNQRVVFQSASQAREFAFNKLLGYQHDPEAPVTFFQVSNRQKVSGIEYDFNSVRTVRFHLSLAIAAFQGEVGPLIDTIKREIQDNQSRKPSPPALLTPTTPSSGPPARAI